MGVAIGAGLGLGLGLLLGRGRGPQTTGDAAAQETLLVLALVVGVALGIWVGGPLGCWVGLRLRRHQRAGPTAALLGLLGPLWVFAAGGFVDSNDFLSWLGPLTTVVGGILNFLVLAVAPLLSRAIVVWFSSEPTG